MYDMSYQLCDPGVMYQTDPSLMCFSGPDGTQFANVNGNCYDIEQQGPQHHNLYTMNTHSDYTDINSLEPSLIPSCDQQMYHYGCPPPIHNSPTGSSSHTSTTSEEHEEYLAWHPYKRCPPEVVVPDYDCRTPVPKRAKQTKKRKPKRDPNEPQKPVSAYALFFRDTQAAIKGQNPNASFGEVSKIVASMWDSLDIDSKNAYKLKTETAKKDYLKQLAAYRANLISRNGCDGLDMGNCVNKLVSPDSTTAHDILVRDAQVDALGEKSLASLIAEPPPQHILTATTTLTVPQSYIPSRGKCDPEDEMHSNGQFCPSQGLVQHCRDVFNIWGGPQTNQPPGYAPV